MNILHDYYLITMLKDVYSFDLRIYFLNVILISLFLMCVLSISVYSPIHISASEIKLIISICCRMPCI